MIRPTTLTALFVLAGLSVASAQQATGTFSAPKKANDEVVTVRWKDGDGKNHSFEGQTGQPGTKNEGDDLPKGMDPKEKAKRIKQALEGSGLDVELNADGDGVVVKPPDGGKIKGFKVTNNTRERRNRTRITSAAGAAQAAHLHVDGFVAGFDGDGEPAELSFGVEGLTVALETAAFPDVPGLVAAMAAELAGFGFEVDVTSDRSLTMSLPDGAALAYGCTDEGLVQSAEVALLEEDDSAETEDDADAGE
ncbi:MAG: hypothetical protein ACF8XB_15965 [Planctomycetota bacterium JB042]